MTANDRSDLEPIDPCTAQQLYIDHKSSQYSDATVLSHEYRLNHFVSWCADQGLDNMNDLSGRDLHEYRLWRKEQGELNKISMQTQMSTLRVFLKWCGSIEAVDPDLYNKVLVPQVRGEEEQRDVMLEAERAEEILQHLSKYHYASREHVLFALLWETGMRIGAARSLDVRDVNVKDRCLDVSHRPETGTTLKNAEGGERLVAISADLVDLLQDYMDIPEPRRLASTVAVHCYRGTKGDLAEVRFAGWSIRSRHRATSISRARTATVIPMLSVLKQ